MLNFKKTFMKLTPGVDFKLIGAPFAKNLSHKFVA